jgi:hypothetical protein
MTLVEKMNNPIKARPVGLDRREPEANIKDTRPRFSVWNR